MDRWMNCINKCLRVAMESDSWGGNADKERERDWMEGGATCFRSNVPAAAAENGRCFMFFSQSEITAARPDIAATSNGVGKRRQTLVT